MPSLESNLEAQLGFSPFIESSMLQFNRHILLSTPHIFALPLRGVFFTCYYIHSVLHPTGQFYPNHQHDEAVEIQFCLRGEYLIESEGHAPLRLRSGEGVVIVPGLTHQSTCVKKGVRLTARATINGPATGAFSRSLAQQATDSLLVFDGREQEMIIGELFRVLLGQAPNPWKYEVAGSLIRSWLGVVLVASLDLREYASASPATDLPGQRGNALCERASAYIYDNFQNPLRIDDIARYTRITPRHLNRLFKKSFGVSVGHLLREVRLREAFRILVENSRASVKEVAYRTGFSSPSYFTQCFKQQYGFLPTQVHLNLSKPLEDAIKLINSTEAE